VLYLHACRFVHVENAAQVLKGCGSIIDLRKSHLCILFHYIGFYYRCRNIDGNIDGNIDASMFFKFLKTSMFFFGPSMFLGPSLFKEEEGQKHAKGL